VHKTRHGAQICRHSVLHSEKGSATAQNHRRRRTKLTQSRPFLLGEKFLLRREVGAARERYPGRRCSPEQSGTGGASPPNSNEVQRRSGVRPEYDFEEPNKRGASGRLLEREGGCYRRGSRRADPESNRNLPATRSRLNPRRLGLKKLIPPSMKPAPSPSDLQ